MPCLNLPFIKKVIENSAHFTEFYRKVIDMKWDDGLLVDENFQLQVYFNIEYFCTKHIGIQFIFDELHFLYYTCNKWVLFIRFSVALSFVYDLEIHWSLSSTKNKFFDEILFISKQHSKLSSKKKVIWWKSCLSTRGQFHSPR